MVDYCSREDCTPAAVIPFQAKPGEREEVVRLISKALPLVEGEEGTLTWLVLRSKTDPDMVFLVDLFADQASRDAHMAGEAAKLILGTVPPLLAAEPVIHAAEVMARK